MTSTAVEGFAADRSDLLEILRRFAFEDWNQRSGCEGWTNKDLIIHLAATCWVLVDPSMLPDAADKPAEEAQELYVASRRDWSPEHVLADYEDVSARVVEQLPTIASVDMEIPLGDLGTYPADLLPNAYTFDHYTHIRADLFGPRGSLAGSPPVSDELRLVPTLEWIDAALPQQNAVAVAELPGSVELVVEGLGSRVITVGSGERVATVTSDGPSFVRWVTQRGTWGDLGVKAHGDDQALAAVRQLKVF